MRRLSLEQNTNELAHIWLLHSALSPLRESSYIWVQSKHIMLIYAQWAQQLLQFAVDFGNDSNTVLHKL